MAENKDRPLDASEIAKNTAEATKALAEADAAAAAAEKTRAEARKATAEAEQAEANLVKMRNDAEREAEKRQEELAAHKHHFVYVFDKEVSATSVNACINQFTLWERSAPEGQTLTIELQINSPGGSVVDGFALIDYIKTMQSRGHVVNTTAFGMAASMGGVILEIGNRRRMGANSVLLIHEAQFGAIGSYGEVEDRVKLVDIFHEKILSLFTERSNVSKSFIKRNWNRRDWWLPAETALKHGFIDEVI